MAPTTPALLLLLAGCIGGKTDSAAPQDSGPEDTGSPDLQQVCDPDLGTFTTNIDNSYLPFAVGDVHVLEGMEAGVDPIRVQISVVDEIVVVEGVTTQVLEEREWEDDELVEVQRHYVVQAMDETVCWYGTFNQWQVGDEGVLPGIWMPGTVEVGMSWEMIHVEDDSVETVEVTAMGETVETPAGTFDDTVTVLEPGPSIKKYAAGIGMIYDDGIELISY